MQRFLTNVLTGLLLAGSLTCGAQAAPSVAQILTANKAAVGQPPRGKPTLQTDYALTAFGMTGSATTQTDSVQGWSVTSMVLGPMKEKNGFDGHAPWDQDTSGVVTTQDTEEAKQLAVNQAYRDSNVWWRADRGGATITAAEKTDSGKSFTVLTVTPPNGKTFDAWFDQGSHQLARLVEKHAADTNTTRYDDYRATNGYKLPGKIITDGGRGEKYLITQTLTKARFVPAQKQTNYAPPKAQVADFTIADGAAETSLPITLINNHIYGTAKFNGKSITAIFDTGGLNLVTPKTAHELGLKVEGTIPGGGAGEGIMEASISHADTITVGDATVHNQQIIILPLDAMAPVEGMPMPGMIGYETFRRFVTRIDYMGGTLTLIDPATFDAKDAGTEIPFILNGRVPQIKGSFEGIPATFDIDTGSRSELTVNKPFAERNNLRATHKGVDAVSGWGVGGPTTGYVTRASEITLGSVKVPNIVAELADQNKGAFAGDDYNGNIGSGLLKRFIVTFDYAHQKMYLKPQTLPVTDISTYDRAGLWINQSADGFEIIAVTKGSPAEAAGLAKGDHITTIDGKAATDLSLADTRKRLRNDAPGTKIDFSISRGGKTKNTTITLRDQI
ncbi:MAG: aspartyl protease family protein [Rhizomicrobium sp.]